MQPCPQGFFRSGANSILIAKEANLSYDYITETVDAGNTEYFHP